MVTTQLILRVRVLIYLVVSNEYVHVFHTSLKPTSLVAYPTVPPMVDDTVPVLPAPADL